MQIYIHDIPVEKNIFEKTYQVIMPNGAYISLPIVTNTGSLVMLGNGAVFESENLAHMLEGCGEMILLAATIPDADAMLEELSKENLALAAEVDEIFSEMVNEALGYIIKMINAASIKKGGAALQARICPGFGDFSIEYQKKIFDMLKLDALDMAINEDFMLTPNKSAITITGVKYGED